MAFYSYWHDGDSRDGDLGDVGPYAAAVLNALRAGTVLNNATMGPYLANDTLGGFACSGAVSPLTLTSGLGHVNGWRILSDASSTIVVPTPAASTRMDILCLQYDSATNQVRAYLHQGVEGAGAYPALTQSAITWEVPLWGVSITTLGAITLVDQRVYVQPTMRISDSQLAALSIARTKLVALERYFLVPPMTSWNAGDDIAIPLESGAFGWPLIDGKLCLVYGKFHVPQDWDGISDILAYPVVLTATATGNVYGAIDARWGSGGQVYNTHTNGNAVAAEAIAAGATLTALTPVTLATANLNKNDIVTLCYARTAGDALDTMGATVYFAGFDVRYTSQ